MGEPCGRSVRAISENGKAVGFEILPDGTWFGWVYDANSGVTEEFLFNPIRTIAHGINNKGTIVGTSVADDGDRAAFIRDKDGSVRTFRATNSDIFDPIFTNARGISENGKVISGFYSNFDFEQVAFVVDSSDVSGAGNTDVEVTTLDIRPCNPDTYSPPVGYVGFTDVLAYEVRNDGVILGSCGDFYWDPVNDPNFFSPIFDFGYAFIATPQK